MKRFSAPPSVYADPTRPPDDDDSDASSLSDGSKKVKTAQSFESLFNSESLSDIILDINRGEYVFHAHKMIVGLKSERLAALITNVISMPPDNSSGKAVLYLQEPSECSAVFSRFLYFIYSGAVWLHRDYVVPLFQLSAKYGVAALAAHCENYIVQILNKMLNIDPSLPLTQSLQISSVCDLFEEPGYRDETKKVAFKVLCKRFADFVRTERWIAGSWTTVRDLLHSDDCTCEENLILVSATDWMKRNKLQDKARIQEILSSIRYPRLPRRVLYHLHATSSFKKFPPVQDLIEAAIRYHCFKDVPEAQAEFSGLQYRARGRNNRSDNNCSNNNNNENSNRNSMHTTMCGVENDDNNDNSPSSEFENDANLLQGTAASPDQNENLNSIPSGEFNTTSSLSPPLPSSSSSSSTILGVRSHTQSHGSHRQMENPSTLRQSNSNNPIPNSPTTAPTLPVRHHRSRSHDRHGSPLRDHKEQREHRITSPGSRHFHQDSTTMFSSTTTLPRRHCLAVGFEPPAVSSFHSPCSPVATIQPLVVNSQNRHNSESIEDCNDNNQERDNDIRRSISPLLSFHNHHHSHHNSNANANDDNNSNNNYDSHESENNNVICHSHIRKL